MPTRAWARRMSGMGLGATAAPAASTAAGLQEAQAYINAAVSQVQSWVAQGMNPRATVAGGGSNLATNQNGATSSINQLVTLGQLTQADANSAIAQLITETNLAASAPPPSVSAAAAVAAPTDTITLPIIGTITYTEAAIGGVVILGGLWLLFGSKKSGRSH